MNKISKNKVNESIVNGTRIYVENGNVKTILNEDIESSDYMSVDECFNIIETEVKKIYELNSRK